MGVLLVDDNVLIRKTLRRLLETCPDLPVLGEAEDGRDALEKAQALQPDLIILDLNMPVMNGLDVAPKLRQMLPNTRLILFTAHDSAHVQALAKAAGIDVVIPKEQAATRLISAARS